MLFDYNGLSKKQYYSQNHLIAMEDWYGYQSLKCIAPCLIYRYTIVDATPQYPWQLTTECMLTNHNLRF